LDVLIFFIIKTNEYRTVFFNLYAAAEPSANVCVAHGTLCNDPNVQGPSLLKNFGGSSLYCLRSLMSTCSLNRSMTFL